jgi:hypothetical protein
MHTFTNLMFYIIVLHLAITRPDRPSFVARMATW